MVGGAAPLDSVGQPDRFLASIALGMQQTVIADVVAIAIIVLIARPKRWADLFFLGAGLVVTLLWLWCRRSSRRAWVPPGLRWSPSTASTPITPFPRPCSTVCCTLRGSPGSSSRSSLGDADHWERATASGCSGCAGVDLLVAGSAHFAYPHLLPSIPWICAALAATPWHQWSVLVADARRKPTRLGAALLSAGVLLAAASGVVRGVVLDQRPQPVGVLHGRLRRHRERVRNEPGGRTGSRRTSPSTVRSSHGSSPTCTPTPRQWSGPPRTNGTTC